MSVAVGVRAQESAAPAAADAAPVAPGLPASVPSTLFRFRAEAVPLKQALALFAHANRLNIVPDLDVVGDVTVDFHDLPLDLAMQALIDAAGYYFIQDGPLIRVRDGVTIVMGGLVQDNATTTRRKVPILGDIPLLGKAFTGKYETKERTELVFFLTPRIIQDAATEPSVTVPSSVAVAAR